MQANQFKGGYLTLRKRWIGVAVSGLMSFSALNYINQELLPVNTGLIFFAAMWSGFSMALIFPTIFKVYVEQVQRD